jgi:hypothetical protein
MSFRNALLISSLYLLALHVLANAPLCSNVWFTYPIIISLVLFLCILDVSFSPRMNELCIYYLDQREAWAPILDATRVLSIGCFYLRQMVRFRLYGLIGK